MKWQKFILLYSAYTFITKSMVFITNSMVWICAGHLCRNMQQHDLKMLDKPTNPGAPIKQAYMAQSFCTGARSSYCHAFRGHASDSFNRTDTKYQPSGVLKIKHFWPQNVAWWLVNNCIWWRAWQHKNLAFELSMLADFSLHQRLALASNFDSYLPDKMFK